MDREAQEEEIEILAEILGSFTLTERPSEETPASGHILVTPHIPWTTLSTKYKKHQVLFDPQEESMTSLETPLGVEAYAVISVEHLPPLKLQFTLPSDYPSISPPIITLSSTWLHLDSLNFLCEKLDSLWEESRGIGILYNWYSFLQDNSLDAMARHFKGRFGPATPYDISFFCQLSTKATTQSKAYPAHSNSDSFREYSESTDFLSPEQEQGNVDVQSWESTSKHANANCLSQGEDSRAVLEIVEIPFLEYLLQYKTYAFTRSTHPCAICLLEKRGSLSFHFQQCGHIFCKECLKGFFTLHISEGSLDSVKCPDSSCKTIPTQNEVKSIVGDESFQRYDKLLLSFTLTSMPDVIYCPRMSCSTPILSFVTDNFAKCDACGYAFCRKCKKLYHGVQSCLTSEPQSFPKQLEEDRNKIQHSSQQMYSSKTSKLLAQKSEEWMASNCIPCPNCRSATFKSEGCNHVRCAACQTNFCWGCGQAECIGNHGAASPFTILPAEIDPEIQTLDVATKKQAEAVVKGIEQIEEIERKEREKLRRQISEIDDSIRRQREKFLRKEALWKQFVKTKAWSKKKEDKEREKFFLID